MSTFILTLLTPVFPKNAEDWQLLNAGKRVSLAAVDPQALLRKGEVERLVWHVPSNAAASLRAVAVPSLLADLVQTHQLQVSPSCVTDQQPLDPTLQDSLAPYYELHLCVTLRVARRLFDSLGLAAPEPVLAPTVVSASTSTSTSKSAPSAAFATASSATTDAGRGDSVRVFEGRFRFWLKGVGISGSAADTLCIDRRLASCLRDCDSGDLVRELGSTLYKIGSAGVEARQLLNDPLEMLRLMRFLDS